MSLGGTPEGTWRGPHTHRGILSFFFWPCASQMWGGLLLLQTPPNCYLPASVSPLSSCVHLATTVILPQHN